MLESNRAKILKDYAVYQQDLGKLYAAVSEFISSMTTINNNLYGSSDTGLTKTYKKIENDINNVLIPTINNGNISAEAMVTLSEKITEAMRRLE